MSYVDEETATKIHAMFEIQKKSEKIRQQKRKQYIKKRITEKLHKKKIAKEIREKKSEKIKPDKDKAKSAKDKTVQIKTQAEPLAGSKHVSKPKVVTKSGSSKHPHKPLKSDPVKNAKKAADSKEKKT